MSIFVFVGALLLCVWHILCLIVSWSEVNGDRAEAIHGQRETQGSEVVHPRFVSLVERVPAPRGADR